MTADWKQGTGTYIGKDFSTYVVRDAGGQAVVVFVHGEKVGEGNAARDVSRRDGKLVVTMRSARGNGEDLPEIPLFDGKSGWWKPGGEVFSAEKPTQIDRRPVRTRGAGQSPARTSSVAAVQGSVATAPSRLETHQPEELPREARELIARLSQERRIYRGPGGVVLISGTSRSGDLEFFAPDDRTPEMHDIPLSREYRHPFLRALRKAPGVRELVNVPYTKFPTQGAVRMHRGGEDAGWYWDDGHGIATYICPRQDAVHFGIRSTWVPAALNNSPHEPTEVLGALAGAEFVFPYKLESGRAGVLVHCSRGNAREITLLLATVNRQEKLPLRTNLVLATYEVTKSTAGRLNRENAARQFRSPRYIVARDTKDVGRIFERP